MTTGITKHLKARAKALAQTIATNWLELFLFVTGLLCSALMLQTLRLHTDNTQLMDKALRLLLEGEWTHFGNMATKVGNIPGSFLTSITAFPMALYFSPWLAMAAVLLIHVMSYYFLRKSLFEIVGSAVANNKIYCIFFALLFWLNPWRVEQTELYNPGYLFIFAAVHLLTALKMKDKNFWFTFWHVLSVGFCFQVHFSFLILTLISIFLLFTEQIKISKAGFGIGVLVVCVSLLPYLMDQLTQHNSGMSLTFTKSDAFFGRNLILVYPVLKAIGYFFRMGSGYFGRHIFSEIEFRWIENETTQNLVSNVFHFSKWIFAVISLTLSLYFLVKVLRQVMKYKPWKRSSLLSEPKNRFNLYFFWLFVSVILASGLSPVEFNHWHLVIAFPSISLMLAITFGKLSRAQRYAYSIMTFLFVLFSIWNVFAAFGSRSHEKSLNYETQFIEHYKKKYVDLDQYLGRSILWDKFDVYLERDEIRTNK